MTRTYVKDEEWLQHLLKKSTDFVITFARDKVENVGLCLSCTHIE